MLFAHPDAVLMVGFRAERAKMEALKVEQRSLDSKFEETFKEELRSLAEAIASSSKSSDQATATAK